MTAISYEQSQTPAQDCTSIRWQFHEAKASVKGVAIHKHHELPTGIVHTKVLAGIVGPLVPKDTLIDEVALLDKVSENYAIYYERFLLTAVSSTTK